MVDFLAKLSPEQRTQHLAHRAALVETIALSPRAFLARAIHIFHNAGDPRGADGQPLHGGQLSYASGLHYIILPELLRRVAGGALPQLCPLHGCGKHIDWDRAFMEPLPVPAAVGNQRERARVALGRLYSNAVDSAALAALRDVLDDAQNGPPDGEADGSIDEVMWTGLSRMADAFAEVQRVHEIMGRPREQVKADNSKRLSVVLANAVTAGIEAAEERSPDKYKEAKVALLRWCAQERVSPATSERWTVPGPLSA